MVPIKLFMCVLVQRQMSAVTEDGGFSFPFGIRRLAGSGRWVVLDPQACSGPPARPGWDSPPQASARGRSGS